MIESTSVTGGWMFYVVPMLTRRSPYASADASVVAPLSSCLILTTLALVFLFAVLSKWAVPGGSAWGKLKGSRTIPGPRGWPVIGSLLGMGDLAHRHLAELAKRHGATRLMALSLGETRVVITSTPEVARELLNSTSFADRPLKQSAQQLLFERAIGFAPYGEYWRKLRRIASNHLFAPKRIAAHEPRRQLETSSMLNAIREDYQLNGAVHIRKYLQRASLNNIMSSVFGLRYGFECGDDEADQLQAMVRQGFELLGAFNWADHLPVLQAVDLHRIHQRCANLVPQVKAFVSKIINEHRQSPKGDASESDFVDVLLSLQGEDKLNDDDMIAVLWEMIFRGTDTTAILTEWILAELVIHPDIQRKVHVELDAIVGSSRAVVEADIPKLSYLQAVVKETLRLHPPGPLLSWARLAVNDVDIAGHWVPAGTTAMVNMWAITHDAAIWNEPHEFKPERFVVKEGGIEFDVRGNDLRLAPFGAGRRVCPGRALGLTTVYIWMARLLHHYEWKEDRDQPVNLEEVLKLSCEMKFPLAAIPVERVPVDF